MKSIVCTLILFVCAIVSVNAQNYQNVVCSNCRGTGGWMTMYGAVACQVCRGYGYVSIPVQNTTSFRGHNTSKSSTVPIYSYHDGRWHVVTEYATLYKDCEGVWKVRLNNVDYVVKTGNNFYGKTKYIYIGMGYYYYL